MTVQMSSDPRPISAIFFPGDDSNWYQVGGAGVTKIEIYQEPGEMGMVPWIAVYQGTHLWQRIPARFCIVQYRPSGEPDDDCPF